jgi:hypothetical protein
MRSTPRLPGRDGLLERLERLVQDPATRLVALTGPAGVGKSRVLEVLEETLADHALVLGHVCRPRDAVQGGALGGLLDRMGRRLTPSRLLALHEEPGLRLLFAHSPSLAGRGVATEDPAAFQFMPLLESLVTLLVRLSADRPLVLSLDDLQHMDESTRGLLEGLLAHPALDSLDITILVSCRELDALPFMAEWERLLGRMPGLVRVPVEPLDAPGVRELLVHELDPEAPQSLEAVLGPLLEASRGLPFLALGLLRQARRAGRIRATLDGWHAEPARDLFGGEREGLVNTLLAPLLEKSPASRHLLTWLRVAGGAAPLDPLRRAAPARAVDWESLARDLATWGVLRRVDRPEGPPWWEFSHALWTEAGGAWLEDAEQHELMRRVSLVLDGDALEERVLRAALLGDLARDSGRAGEREAAVRLLEELLDVLETESAPPDLVLRLARRLRELALAPDARSRGFLAALRAALEINSTLVVADLLENSDLDGLDAVGRLALLEHMPRLFTIRGQPERLAAWLSDMERRDDLCGPERAALLLARLQRRNVRGDWEGAEAEFQQLEALDATPAQAAWGTVLRCVADPGGKRSPRERFDALEELLRTEGGLLDGHQRVQVFHELVSMAHLFAGQPRLKPWLDPMVEEARRLGRMSVSRHRDYLARTLVLAQRYPEAEQILRESLASLLARRQWAVAAESAHFLLNLLRRQRRLGDCMGVVEQLEGLLGDEPNTYTRRALLLTCASVSWRLHHTRRAAELLDRLEACPAGDHSPELALALAYSRAHVLVQAAETGGDWAPAAEACRLMVERYQELGRSDMEMLLFAVMRDRALVHLHGADPSRRAGDYLPALAAARERGEYDLVRFLVQVGELSLLTGEDPVADAVEEALADVEADAALAGVFRVSRSLALGRDPEARVRLAETRLLLSAQPADGLARHLALRWPELELELPARPWPARFACLWSWALANQLESGREAELPGLPAGADLVERVDKAVAALERDASAAAAAERERLERELGRLDLWLEGRRPRGARGQVLRVLGPLRLEVDGHPVDPATLRTRVGLELLALLALRAWQGRGRLTRDEILDALTVDGRPLVGESSLRVVISRLRKGLQALDADLILYQDQSYFLAPGLALRVDAVEFEEAWRLAQEALRRNRVPEAERQLDECLGLYRGRFLPGGADWTGPLRAHFERRLLDAARTRARLLDDRPALRDEFLARLRARLPELAEFLTVEA